MQVSRQMSVVPSRFFVQQWQNGAPSQVSPTSQKRCVRCWPEKRGHRRSKDLTALDGAVSPFNAADRDVQEGSTSFCGANDGLRLRTCALAHTITERLRMCLIINALKTLIFGRLSWKECVCVCVSRTSVLFCTPSCYNSSEKGTLLQDAAENDQNGAIFAPQNILQTV